MPLIMGILNLTPDSFYDGGKYNNIKKAVNQARNMISEGADIIDLGACSSRPGSQPISLKEEEKRLFPILLKLREIFPEIIISIDTYRYQIAGQAIHYGANLINDIYIEKDEDKMLQTIQKHDIPYVLMHMSGNPTNMQKQISYNHFEKNIKDFFIQKIRKLENYEITKIILDPGFGFGKTLYQNYELINLLPKMMQLKYPILTGISRKSMISKALNIHTNDTINGTTVLNTICLMKGAKIIRVHDVKEAKESLEIFKLVAKNNPNPSIIKI